jgi:hypothetical protein
MNIVGSGIALSARSSSVRQTSEQETLRMWVGGSRPDFEGRAASAAGQRPPPARLEPEDLLTLSGGKPAGEGRKAKAADEADEPQAGSKEQVHILLIEKMIELLTGRKVKIRQLELDRSADAEAPTPPPGSDPAAPPAGSAGFGVEYDRTVTRYEKETFDFAASGSVRTADGQEIRFDLSLSLSRETFEQSSVSFRAGDGRKVDPLVIDFDGRGAKLTDTKFAFDLDADGKAENVSFVGQGSGFLAIDRDGTGVVADGRQLFGPSTGNGFAELAKLDGDGNGWIDEQDAAYSELRIWTKDADGKDALATLAEKKVGAIYLGNVAADYALKDGAGNVDGELRRTGVWVAEDGKGAGLVQQVDLAV